ncbi:flagellar biosynthesis repressor FlbT [Bradyrhizobium sp. 2TAF24]|uniref:flagellar biosynthesis repressor FlbT n=1 Tax=Bradyrhizobium sp. 2TAF24 TaxID=3233011 RepID=UPI003F8EF51A
MCISLRSGEKIYVNGAVLRVDRKVTLELVNDVTFLLENQVMQVADATTPLRQLYFVVQLMLMNPQDVADAKAVYWEQHNALRQASGNADIIGGLAVIGELVEARRYYDALRKIRSLFEVEQMILAGKDAPQIQPAELAGELPAEIA